MYTIETLFLRQEKNQEIFMPLGMRRSPLKIWGNRSILQKENLAGSCQGRESEESESSWVFSGLQSFQVFEDIGGGSCTVSTGCNNLANIGIPHIAGSKKAGK